MLLFVCDFLLVCFLGGELVGFVVVVVVFHFILFWGGFVCLWFCRGVFILVGVFLSFFVDGGGFF